MRPEVLTLLLSALTMDQGGVLDRPAWTAVLTFGGHDMMVWHVMQDAKPGHNTSYRTGWNWVESHDCEDDAQRRAAMMNQCRNQQCIGVEYVVTGPMDESEDITERKQHV